MQTLQSIKTDTDVINYVKTNLVIQNQKSALYDESGNLSICLYRDIDNNKCAVGQLIKDDIYRDYIERTNPDYSEVQRMIRESVPNWIINNELLDDMQKIHDHQDVSDWDGLYSRMLDNINMNGIYTKNEDDE